MSFDSGGEMSSIEISLLGPMQVTVEGLAVPDFEADSARALLAYLVISREVPSPREVLAGLLWPEWSESDARRNLRSALYRVRMSIGDHGAEPPFLDISRDAVQFSARSDYWLDVEAFTNLIDATRAHAHTAIEHCPVCIEKFTEAAKLYRGDFMQGFSYPSAALEEWIVVQREALHLQALDALHHLAAFHEWRGDYLEALSYARQQVALEPWRESAHRQWMRALALSGQRTAALAQYKTCRQILEVELGVEPETATQALYQAIRDGTLNGSGLAITGPLAPVESRPQPRLSLPSLPGNHGSPVEPKAQRRPAAVVVAHVSGSTQFLACADVPSWAREMNGALQVLAVEGHRWGGTLHHLGHEHIALTFGGGAAHEPQLEQAVSAALGMRAAFDAHIKALRGRGSSVGSAAATACAEELQVRIGVGTDEAAVEAGEPEIVEADLDPVSPLFQSMALIVAEQVQKQVAKGTVWVDEETYHRVTSRFDWAWRTILSVPGVARPVTIYRPLPPARAAMATAPAELAERAESSG